MCINEKVQINAQAGKNCLNKRTEISQACRHKVRFKLAT